MLNHFLPRSIDNTYRGQKPALWIFGLILVLRLLMAFNSIFFTEQVAVNADGIPLATYSPAAAHTIISLFASLGLAHLMLMIIAALVLLRYRSMIPFMYALLLTEQATLAPEAVHVIDKNLALLLTVGISAAGLREFPLPPTEAAAGREALRPGSAGQRSACSSDHFQSG